MSKEPISAEEIRKTCKKIDEFIGPMTGGTYTVWESKHIIALIHEDDNDVVVIKEKATGATIYEHKRTAMVARLLGEKL